MKNLFIPALALLLAISACKPDDPAPIEPPNPPNILLIIADDMGKDATNGFSEGSIKPNTPHIDAIQNDGITFSNCWVYPTCTPTRSSIITGKYGYRTGVKVANDVLDESETLLHAFINQQSSTDYATAIVGKWHLSGNNVSNVNPEDRGMDYYAGLLRGGVDNYYRWMLSEDGAQTTQTSYITEAFTDLAIDWLTAQDKPWFLWLAYTAPHTPFHVPPAEMHSQGSLPEYSQGMDPIPYYMAAIEAMDYQIGRLLDSMSVEERENTVIFFIGDNGTPNQAAQAPYNRNTVKGTLYQGGINTPLFVSGAGVSRAGEVDDNLICSTDLFATITELAGGSVSNIHDSKSFVSLLSSPGTHRSFQYSEMRDTANDRWTISDGQYKLIEDVSGGQEMYDLGNDAYETNNLLSGALSADQASAKLALEDELTRIRD